MIGFLNIIRIIGLIIIIIYACLYIFKNYENIYLLFIGIIIIVISSFLISFLNYEKIIKPFFQENGFSKCNNLSKIKKDLIKSSDINIDFAFCKDDLSILKLNLNDTYYDLNNKRKDKSVFKGIYILKNNVNQQSFSIANDTNFKNFLGIKNDISLLDNVDFNKYFKLYTDDKTSSFRFLNPKKLISISKNAKLLKRNFSIFYKNNDLHIYIHNFSFSKNIKEEFKAILELINEF